MEPRQYLLHKLVMPIDMLGMDNDVLEPDLSTITVWWAQRLPFIARKESSLQVHGG